MKITKEQRIKAYRYAIDYYENATDGYRGMCSLLYCISNSRLGIVTHMHELSDTFHEVFSLRPPSTGVYWFPRNEEGRLQRIELLTKAIELAEKSES